MEEFTLYLECGRNPSTNLCNTRLRGDEKYCIHTMITFNHAKRPGSDSENIHISMSVSHTTAPLAYKVTALASPGKKGFSKPQNLVHWQAPVSAKRGSLLAARQGLPCSAHQRICRNIVTLTSRRAKLTVFHTFRWHPIRTDRNLVARRLFTDE